LASSRQYGNALLGVRHQEEEVTNSIWSNIVHRENAVAVTDQLNGKE